MMMIYCGVWQIIVFVKERMVKTNMQDHEIVVLVINLQVFSDLFVSLFYSSSIRLRLTLQTCFIKLAV